MIDWDDSFRTGINIIDTQHKMMFKMARQLELLLQVPTGVKKVDEAVKLLCDLRNYVTFHYYEEEKLMESVNYPDIELHKIEHENFRKKIESIDIRNFYNDNYTDLSIFLNSLYGWVFDHIGNADLKIKQYIDENK